MGSQRTLRSEGTRELRVFERDIQDDLNALGIPPEGIQVILFCEETSEGSYFMAKRSTFSKYLREEMKNWVGKELLLGFTFRDRQGREYELMFVESLPPSLTEQQIGDSWDKVCERWRDEVQSEAE